MNIHTIIQDLREYLHDEDLALVVTQIHDRELSEMETHEELKKHRAALNIAGDYIGYSRCGFCHNSFLWTPTSGVQAGDGKGVILGCKECVQTASYEHLCEAIEQHPALLSDEEKIVARDHARRREFDAL